MPYTEWNAPTAFTVYPPNPTLMAENLVLQYVSSSYANTNLIDPATEFFAGVAKDDKDSPAVVVSCNQGQEVVFQSRVYRFDVDVSCRMIAYDNLVGPNVTSSAISLSGQIYALFGNSQQAVDQMNTFQTGLAVIQVQVMDYQNERMGDAWISNLKLSLVGTLVGH